MTELDKAYTFTEETEIAVPDGSVQEVHLEDLSFVIDVETDGDEVTSCTIDLQNLIQAMTVFSSMERFEYNWRSFHDLSFNPTKDLTDDLEAQ
jgi:hypothetical protein